VVVVVFGLQQEQDYFSLHTSPIMIFSSSNSQLFLGYLTAVMQLEHDS
jgi:hypothetical protein